jgi:hypothetical protein
MVVWARPGAAAAEPQPSEEPGANAREEQPHAEEPRAQASDDRLPVPSKSRAAARRTASSSTMVTGGDLLKSGNMLERPLRAWCIAEDPRAEIEMRVAPIVAPGKRERPRSLGASFCQTFSAVRRYLTISYMVTPRPLGQTARLTGLTNLVVVGTKTRPHASAGVAKKAPVQVNPSQTPAPTLAKTK